MANVIIKHLKSLLNAVRELKNDVKYFFQFKFTAVCISQYNVY